MYKHIVQANPLCCGAACMEMVYDYFGLAISQENIWNDIARPNPFWGLDCSPQNMEKHFHFHNFCAMDVVAISSIELFLPWIVELNLSIIVNYKLAENHYHFVLFERIFQDGIIVQDPSSTIENTYIPYEVLLQPQTMLIGPSTQMAKCPYCKVLFPSSEIFSGLYSQHIARCAYCQEELFYVDPL